MTVTLCNTRQDIASIITQQAAGGGGGARAAAKEAEEDHAWFVDTTSHVAMVAEAIIGRDGDTVDWSRVAEIIVDGSGIHQMVIAAQGSLVTAFGRLDMNDESLTTIFEKTGVNSLEDGDTLYSRITQTAESITAEVTRATTAEGSLSSRITQTAESISLVVNNGSIDSASIVAAINSAGSSVKIAAGHIILDGDTVASSLYGKDIAVDDLITAYLETQSLEVTGSANIQGTLAVSTLSADTISGIDNLIASIGPASASGGEITIPYTTYGGDSGSINFNIADTQYYMDGVSAAEATGWNAARDKVEPPAQGSSDSFTFKAPSATKGQQQTYTFTIQKGAVPASTGYASVALSGVLVGRIEIGTWYDAGVTDGESSVTLSNPSWGSSGGTSSTYTVTASNGESKSQSLYLSESAWSSGSKTVYMRTDGYSGTARAQRTVSIPEPSNWSIRYNASGETVQVTIGGTTFTHEFT